MKQSLKFVYLGRHFFSYFGCTYREVVYTYIYFKNMLWPGPFSYMHLFFKQHMLLFTTQFQQIWLKLNYLS